jgi:prepilin-type N-terminal cleavage/methylation domain-containing protein
VDWNRLPSSERETDRLTTGSFSESVYVGTDKGSAPFLCVGVTEGVLRQRAKFTEGAWRRSDYTESARRHAGFNVTEEVLRQRAGLSNGARQRRAGFTLVEVIVVLVILAILAAIAIPALTGYIDKAHEKALISQARASAEAIQTWASEHFANGDVGDEGLKNGDGPVSLANYTGGASQSGLPLAGSDGKASGAVRLGLPFTTTGGKTGVNAAAAEYGLPFTVASNKIGGVATTAEYGFGESPVITAEPYRGDGTFHKMAGASTWYTWIIKVTYNFWDENNNLISSTTYQGDFNGYVYDDGEVTDWDHAEVYDDVHYPLTYERFALGASPFPTGDPPPGNGWLPIPDPDSHAGYIPTEETQKLFTEGTTIVPDSKESWSGGFLEKYNIILDYEVVPTNGEEGGDEGGDEGGEGDGASDWVKIVDKLASTNLAAAGYTITEVHFSDMNLLTHMKLTEPENGDFVVYADGAYTFNFDPAEGDAT